MKAITYHKYGSPDVLNYAEVEKPTPNDDQVLVKVHAASINPYEWHFMRGDPLFMRFMTGVFKPKDTRLGSDLAGRVEAIGKNIKKFKVGDSVFGAGLGALADYVCITENRLTLKPNNSSFEEAASLPIAAITALQGLRDKGQIKPGQKVLINGASGGIGTFAVQIARSFGTEVTGVCSTSKMELVRSIGADHVIDYTREDVTRNGQTYDLILDNAAYRSVSNYKRILSPDGIYVLAGGAMAQMFQMMLFGSWMTRGTNQKMTSIMAEIISEDLLVLKELLESSKVVPVIDKCYPLSETADAIRYLEAGHARGKVLITVGQNN